MSEIGRGHQRADGKAQGGAARGTQREEPDERRRLQVEGIQVILARAFFPLEEAEVARLERDTHHRLP